MRDPVSDLAALQGRWEQVGFEENGVPDAPDDYQGAMGAITTFRENRFTVHASGGVLLLEGCFELEPGISPKAVTWIDAIGPDAGKRLPGIYTLEGDHFVFVAADEGAPRPTAFRTEPGQTMRCFVRRQ